MKYKGIFFDWFNTLAGYETPRERLYQKAFQEAGIELNLSTIYRGIQRGDRYYFSKSAPLNTAQTLEDQARYYCRYPQFISDEAHLDVSSDTQIAVLKKALTQFSGRMVLFSDCLPVMKQLKERNLVVGIITNADAKILKVIAGAGLGTLVDSITTSEEARSEKPDAAIFRLALSKTGLKPQEAIFVGDQYQNDVVGANGAGLKAILLDRQEALADGRDYVRIKTLSDIIDYLE